MKKLIFFLLKGLTTILTEAELLLTLPSYLIDQMNTDTMTQEKYPELSALLAEVFVAAEQPEFAEMSRIEVLKAVMKKKHYWPEIQIKKFFDRSGLVLLTNTYNKKVDKSFQALYDQCRSVVINIAAETPECDRIVINIGGTVPVRMTCEEYARSRDEKGADAADLEYHVATDGAFVYAYKHGEKWYYSTTSCPLVDRSALGPVLDDAIAKIAPVETQVQEEDAEMHDDTVHKRNPLAVAQRDWFSSQLNPELAYTFVIVHHKNRRIMDYTDVYGNEYAKLILVGTKDRVTMEDYSFHDSKYNLCIPGLEYPVRFETFTGVQNHLSENPNTYGVIAKSKSEGTLIMIANSTVIRTEGEHMGNKNPWVNMLSIYQQNKPDFHVRDYIQKYLQGWPLPEDMNGNPIQPVALLTTVFNTLQSILYDAYRYTTTLKNGRYRVLKHLDETLPPVIRFHIAQLRNIQITPQHCNLFISSKVVYDYLCFHVNTKNLRIIIQFFATTGMYLSPNAGTAFTYLNQLLQD